MNCCCENMSVRVLLAGLLLLVAATTLFHVHVVRACIHSERLSLLNFKLGVVDHYNVLSSWTQSSHRDCCTWTGIRCDNRTHHVISIDLHSYSYYPIGGLIGPSLVELQYLEHLDLSWNYFTQIPKFIGSFKSLKYLDLGRNPVSGAIPSQLGNLTKLQFLRLGTFKGSGQLIADNLQWLSHLPFLTSFVLHDANFTKAGLQSFKIPPSLSTLEVSDCQFPEDNTSSLSHANSSNSLQTLYFYVTGAVNPSQLGNLTKLKNLDFNAPMITNNFKWLSDLPSLTTLALGYTNFTKAGLQSFKLPPSLSSLELYGCHFPQVDGISSLFSANSSNSLTSLMLNENTIHPSVLAWLLNSSTNLVDLEISFNDGLGNQIAKSLGNLTSLHTLDLSENNLNETLQDLLESLSGCLRISLQELDLSGNLLDGPFPNRLSQFPNLVVFNLAGNRLTGSLPDLSTMSFLREFDASNNKFNGTLAESIGHLHNLESLDVSFNPLVGIVSEVHFQKLSNLKYLDLSSNSLTFRFNSNWLPPFQLDSLLLSSCKIGPQFPSWLHNQINLSVLDMSNSGIFGAIPPWFSDLTLKLGYLNLSFNLMNSTLPDFPLRSDLSPVVDLSSNQFHGSIPPSLSNASEIYLSNNKFSKFRSFLCKSLDGKSKVLDLSNNLISGDLPNCWWNWEELRILNLESNTLSGVIPSSIGLLHQIVYLNLRHNKFSGNLPSLGYCTFLQILDVGENNLQGEIPTWFGERLIYLVFLSIKSNRFYGSTPTNICNMQSIKILDFSCNNISGAIPSCFHNFTSMVQKQDEEDTYISIYSSRNSVTEADYSTDTLITWKGQEQRYKKILGLLRIIDLSSNRIYGEIPKEFIDLIELVQLNLSRNELSGRIPENIGKLSKLESLDLSHNKLSGKIPVSLANVFTLGYLDLSNNRLSGRIPIGTQLQSFDASAYAGNLELCGQPLMPTCPGDDTLKGARNSEEGFVEDGEEWCDMSWLRMGIGVGFVVGFCGVCGNLLLYTPWRLAYFRFLDNLGDWLYVIIAVKWNTFKRMISR